MLLSVTACRMPSSFFFFNDTATTEIYTLSLHDALPILPRDEAYCGATPTERSPFFGIAVSSMTSTASLDRKSTRLNSSHSQISYAVFCLKKKNDVFATAAITRWGAGTGDPTSPQITPAA